MINDLHSQPIRVGGNLLTPKVHTSPTPPLFHNTCSLSLFLIAGLFFLLSYKDDLYNPHTYLLADVGLTAVMYANTTNGNIELKV